jgi:hypothetical protein
MNSTDLTNQYGFGNITSVGGAFTNLVKPGFSIAAVAVAIYLLIGAIKIMASAGDKEAVAGGRNMITHAIIGFVLLIVMFLVFRYIPSFFRIGFKLI